MIQLSVPQALRAKEYSEYKSDRENYQTGFRDYTSPLLFDQSTSSAIYGTFLSTLYNLILFY